MTQRAVVWLASFPRSGSALTQVLLWQCFGIRTWRLRPEAASPAESHRDEQGDSPDQNSESHQRFFGGRHRSFDSLDAILAEPATTGRPGPVVVKTHGLPSDNRPALVIVRDGRSALASFEKFRRVVSGNPVSIETLIRHPRLNWSAHAAAWLDRPAPTLVLRFEELVTPDAEVLERIGAFLDMPRVGESTATVDDMRAMRPNMVNTGRNQAGIAEVENRAGDLFWQHHGTMMDRLGYRR